MLTSRTFANAPNLRRFLEHIVQHTLDGAPGQLKEYALGVDVFDRGADFDPRADTIVRVQARRLRQKLADYYRTEGRGDPILIDVPRGAYVPEFRPAPRPAERPGPVPMAGFRVRVRAESGLPAPPTAVVGRERELEEVRRLLTDGTRLVTLTGAGGSGKTRLALQAAAELAGRFPGGVLFVDLAAVSAPASVTSAIAQRLGVGASPGRPLLEAVRAHLRHNLREPMLLVLDNFEHLLPAAPAVGKLLETSDLLQLLVTSRAALRITGEHEYAVPPLPLPDPAEFRSPDLLSRNPAIVLFTQRARAAMSDFSLTPENAPAVAKICVRVDGLPLGIELAAARIKVFPPVAILSQLERGLDFLSGGPRDLPARQRTLRNTLDWSHGLLTSQEQRLFRRLSAFRGGFTLEAAEAVCNTRHDLGIDAVDGVTSLLDKNLIHPAGATAGEARFSMLEILREYAFERLHEAAEAAGVLKSHAAYCLVLAEEGAAQLTDAARHDWLARCDLEHDNFRAALGWLLEQDDADWGLRLVLALFPFWERREHLVEGRDWTEAVLELRSAAARTARRAKALAYLGSYLVSQGELDHGRNQEALEIYQELGDRRGVLAMLNSLSVQRSLQNDWPGARTWLEESLATARQLGDPAATGAVLSNLAGVVRAQGDGRRARALLDEALSLFQQAGDASGAGWSLNHLGDLARERGHFDDARRMYEEGAETFGRCGDAWGAARSLIDLGRLSCDEGQHTAAASFFRRALTAFCALDHGRGIAKALEGLAEVALQSGFAERALRFAGVAAAVRQAIGAPPRPRDKARADEVVAAASAHLEPEGAQAIWREASEMALDAAIGYALEALEAPTA